MSDPLETRLFRGTTVLSMIGPPLEDGGLAVRGGEILDVGPWTQLMAEYS